MSEINPAFSFPTFSSNSFSPLSHSPRRRHAHRRSAAMSEDLSAQELVGLVGHKHSYSQGSMAPPGAHTGGGAYTSYGSPNSYVSSHLSGPPPMFPPPISPKYFDHPHSSQVHSPFNSPSKQFSGEPGEIVSGFTSEKKKKRRSFVQLFKKNKHEENVVSLERSNTVYSSSTLSSVERNFTPPPMDDVNLIESPLSTPRSSGEMFREPELPTIDLDLALQTSFTHRRQDSVLDSPFSKAPSMHAVLEEADEEEEEASSDNNSLSSGYRTKFLHKTASLNSQHQHSPRTSVLKSRSIVYVGPISPKPILSPPSPRSPIHRASIDQVQQLSIPKPKSTQPKGHQRRRSLIDRILRRDP